MTARETILIRAAPTLLASLAELVEVVEVDAQGVPRVPQLFSHKYVDAQGPVAVLASAHARPVWSC